MNMLEQVNRADIMLVNDVATQNFGYNADDNDEYWCLSIYGYDPESRQNFEYFLGKSDVLSAVKCGSAWKVSCYGDTKFELCQLNEISEE